MPRGAGFATVASWHRWLLPFVAFEPAAQSRRTDGHAGGRSLPAAAPRNAASCLSGPNWLLNGSRHGPLCLQVLVGHPDYEVTGGSAVYKGQDLFEVEPEERSHMGLFLRWALGGWGTGGWAGWAGAGAGRECAARSSDARITSGCQLHTMMTP